MNKSTKDAFVIVLDAMIRSANYKIGGIRRSKYGRKDTFITREEKFKANCNFLKERLNSNGRLPLKFLREDQYSKDVMRENLNYILGGGHNEIENILQITFPM